MEPNEEWDYLAIDVRPVRFGDVLGELNRTGWEITGSEELDEKRQPLAISRLSQMPDTGWYRIYAKRRV